MDFVYRNYCVDLRKMLFSFALFMEIQKLQAKVAQVGVFVKEVYVYMTSTNTNILKFSGSNGKLLLFRKSKASFQFPLKDCKMDCVYRNSCVDLLKMLFSFALSTEVHELQVKLIQAHAFIKNVYVYVATIHINILKIQ